MSFYLIVFSLLFNCTLNGCFSAMAETSPAEIGTLQERLIPYSHFPRSSGLCVAVSDIWAMQLEALGVKVSKVLILFGKRSTFRWSHHVAPSIIDSNGKIWVFDPSRFFKMPIPLQDWVHFYSDGTGCNSTEALFFPDLASRFQVVNGSLRFRKDQNQLGCFVFTVSAKVRGPMDRLFFEEVGLGIIDIDRSFPVLSGWERQREACETVSWKMSSQRFFRREYQRDDDFFGHCMAATKI